MGLLLYLVDTARLETESAVECLPHFTNQPTKGFRKVGKRILWYLKETTKWSILYQHIIVGQEWLRISTHTGHEKGLRGNQMQQNCLCRLPSRSHGNLSSRLSWYKALNGPSLWYFLCVLEMFCEQ